MRVNRVTSAASVLLVAEGLDHDWVVERALAGGIEWAHVEDVNAVHLAENLETLETGGLVEVGWHGASWGSRWEEVVLGLNLCVSSYVSATVLGVS
jgi:hypothetical protein